MGHLELCGWHSNRAEAAKKEKSSCVESVLAAQGCGGKSPQGESFEIPSVRLLGGMTAGPRPSLALGKIFLTAVTSGGVRGVSPS